MPLLEEIAAKGPGFELAIAAATISILLGGLMLGTGMGFGIRRLRLLGAEEIGQGIISAAMVGALAAFVLALEAATSSIVPQGALPACQGVENPSGSPYGFYMCHLYAQSFALQQVSSSYSRSAEIAGMASSLRLNVGVVEAQPFFALEAASRKLSDLSFAAGAASALAFFELELGSMARSAALSVFLPAGLLLRTFFATRKLGAAAMAMAIAAYAVYPLLFLWGFSESRTAAAAQEASSAADSFNEKFASIPLLDLDDTGAVRREIASMSQGDFGSEVQMLFAPALRAISLSNSDLIVYPIASAIVSLVAAFELYRLLSAPLALPYFEAV